MTYGVKRRAREPGLPRPRQGALPLLLALFLSSWIFAAGCSDASGDAVGCSESNCRGDDRCIQGSCRPRCSEQSECPIGRNCALWGFADGTQGSYCVTLPYAEDGSTGQFEACSSDDDCDTLRGFRCNAGECVPRCRSHFDCASVGHCGTVLDDAGNRAQFCQRDAEPQTPGGFYTSCPNGNECDASAGFMCLGVGPADLEAYCTRDCGSDADCAAGYFCSKIVRGPPCEDQCGFQGVADNPECIPTDQIGEGLTYQCGNFGLERRVCRTREFCSPCESDIDCLAVPNTLCASDASGAKMCTQLCDPVVGSCPWGNAGLCGLFDRELNLPTCAHRSGSCTGAGLGCDPCVTDADCGPGNVCNSSSFTGERWCIDLSVSCDCEGSPTSGSCPGGGCPETPSGLSMICIDDPGTVLDGACYGANTSPNPILASPQTGCWAPL